MSAILTNQNANSYTGDHMQRLLLSLFILVIVSTSSAYAATPLTAESFNLDQYKGKVVYLDFWASWCGPCKFSFPYMEQQSYLYRDKDFVIITVNLDKSNEKAQAFLRDVNTKLPVVFDPNGVLAEKYAVKDMPTSILFDRTGKLRTVHQGFFRDKEREYTAHILELLNEK